MLKNLNKYATMKILQYKTDLYDTVSNSAQPNLKYVIINLFIKCISMKEGLNNE